MIKFEIVSKYKHAGLSLPERKTGCSAGYDFATAEDVVLEPYAHLS
jgi:dUTP pyrophosphatase